MYTSVSNNIHLPIEIWRQILAKCPAVELQNLQVACNYMKKVVEMQPNYILFKNIKERKFKVQNLPLDKNQVNLRPFVPNIYRLSSQGTILERSYIEFKIDVESGKVISSYSSDEIVLLNYCDEKEFERKIGPSCFELTYRVRDYAKFAMESFESGRTRNCEDNITAALYSAISSYVGNASLLCNEIQYAVPVSVTGEMHKYTITCAAVHAKLQLIAFCGRKAEAPLKDDVRAGYYFEVFQFKKKSDTEAGYMKIASYSEFAFTHIFFDEERSRLIALEDGNPTSYQEPRLTILDFSKENAMTEVERMPIVGPLTSFFKKMGF